MPALTKLSVLLFVCLLAAESGAVATAQQPDPLTVDYPAGWNLVSGPSTTAFTEALGSLYSLDENGVDYGITPTVTRLPAGDGWWPYFPQPVEKTFASGNTEPMKLNLSPGIFRMIGNPFLSLATVTGVDALFIYDPAQGYQETTTIPVGRGAFAYSASGGIITISDSQSH